MSDRMTSEAKCACLRVDYEPEDVEMENPITGEPIMGKRDRWACRMCGAEFGRSLWHNAVVKQQQEHIHDLEARLARVRELPRFHIETTYPMMDKGPSIKWVATKKGDWVRADEMEAAIDESGEGR